MGSNTEKKLWANLQHSYNYFSKEIKSDNFCYRKVGRAITKWGAIEKSPISLSQYWKSYHFERVKKNISHFDDSNYFFADCILACCTLYMFLHLKGKDMKLAFMKILNFDSFLHILFNSNIKSIVFIYII